MDNNETLNTLYSESPTDQDHETGTMMEEEVDDDLEDEEEEEEEEEEEQEEEAQEGPGKKLTLQDRIDARKRSIASDFAEFSSKGGLIEAIRHDTTLIQQCRTILTRPRQDRLPEDLLLLKSLLFSSRALQQFQFRDIHQELSVCKVIQYEKIQRSGTYVFKEGDVGNHFYIIFSGFVSITKLNDAGEDVEVSQLGPGDSFGERALKHKNERRQASVRTTFASTELLSISRLEFEKVLRHAEKRHLPGVKRQDWSSVANLHLNQSMKSTTASAGMVFQKQPEDRTADDIAVASSYLATIPIFQKFSHEIQRELSAVMLMINVWADTVLFAEGSPGQHFYHIFTGEVQVTKKGQDIYGFPTQVPIVRLSDGDCFGELALDDDETAGIRTASATTAYFTRLLVLSRQTYQAQLQKATREITRKTRDFLRRCPVFHEWPDKVLEGMCTVLKEKQFPCHTTLYEQVGVLDVDKRLSFIP